MEEHDTVGLFGSPGRPPVTRRAKAGAGRASSASDQRTRGASPPAGAGGSFVSGSGPGWLGQFPATDCAEEAVRRGAPGLRCAGHWPATDCALDAVRRGKPRRLLDKDRGSCEGLDGVKLPRVRVRPGEIRTRTCLRFPVHWPTRMLILTSSSWISSTSSIGSLNSKVQHQIDTLALEGSETMPWMSSARIITLTSWTSSGSHRSSTFTKTAREAQNAPSKQAESVGSSIAKKIANTMEYPNTVKARTINTAEILRLHSWKNAVCDRLKRMNRFSFNHRAIVINKITPMLNSVLPMKTPCRKNIKRKSLIMTSKLTQPWCTSICNKVIINPCASPSLIITKIPCSVIATSLALSMPSALLIHSGITC
mmetsp:Transcript_92732/g.247976  ORF Transcript_92732/g.247976 Transcript_92732/m.247976 type:complete len:367 (+) Transcript_92732:1498-2598(+)